MDLTDGIDQFFLIDGKGQVHAVGPAVWRHLPRPAQRAPLRSGSSSRWVHGARALTPRGPERGGPERTGVFDG